jgi:phosphoglycerate dehydrogenase-like enzyme
MNRTQRVVHVALATAVLLFTSAGAVRAAPAEPPIDALIEELGISESSTRSDELPGWRVPLRAYVRERDAVMIDRLRAAAPAIEFVIVRPGQPLPPADVAFSVCTAEALAASPNLRWIQMMSHGVESCLARPEIASPRIAVTAMKNTVDANVADAAMGLLLVQTRGIDWFLRKQWERRWVGDGTDVRAEPDRPPQRELRGKTLLVYGLGGIGTEIAARAHAFGLRVVGIRASGRPGPALVSYVGRPDELLTLARDADVVINAAPLTAATRNVFDARFFEALKAGAYFINVGRGESADTPALIAALRSGRLAGAGLDVTDPEPLPVDHPLWTAPNVVITQHQAAYSAEGMERRRRLAAENLRRYVAGEPLLGPIDVAQGY